MTTALPIDPVLPQITRALATAGRAVLQAPPGAGKTTRVPLALLEAGIAPGRIVMLEPRRLAARAAAERMAETLGSRVGQTVGYRIRGENRTGPNTRIEVVTEGILTRMIQSDPELPGVGAVIFDEFHERSLHADLGLALSLEIREALRDDLLLLVMSATLDAAPVARLLGDAPLITAQGRAWPVETRWLDRPWRRPDRRGPRFEQAMADLIVKAAGESSGDILAFLPGEGEIRRVEGNLKGRLPTYISVHPLFGALDFKAQRAAIAPARTGRKLVLATAIAETSLTIQGVRVVVDGGLARRARFDPASGMSRLVTERVTRAEAEQRRGRAGRVAEGLCYRLWTRGEEGALAAFPPAEIEAADLAPMVLECALWGARDPGGLPFLTSPPEGAVAEARALLQALGALDDTGAITEHGRALAAMPLHPRLGHMLLLGGRDAPMLAALLDERDLLALPGQRAPADLSLRLAALRDPRAFEADHPYKVNRAALARLRETLRRLKPVGDGRLSVGEMAALAYPDRIGLRRKGDAPRYVLSGGKGALFDEAEPLGASRMIVATDLDGNPRESRIRMAAEFSESSLRALYGDQIRQQEICRWSRRHRRVETLVQEVFGALVLSEQRWRDCPPERVAEAMTEGLRDLGFEALPLGKPARLLIARIQWLRGRGADLPDFSAPALMDDLESWLIPHLGKCRSKDDLGRIDLLAALKARLSWEQQRLLDDLAPAAITAPTGTRLAVDYSGEQPSVSVRLQEMFGLTRHPTVGPDRVPLMIELLSPAQRPVQKTADLPGFWKTSYKDVRKDMRGRYPRHPWPEDPTQAPPTRRAKPRGS